MLRMSVITKTDTKSWLVGERVISVFSDRHPKLLPESLFQWENKVADFESTAASEKYWAQTATLEVQGSTMEFPVGLRWKRKKVAKYDAEINHTQRNIKGELIDGSLNVQAQFNNKVDWLDAFRSSCLAMDAHFALLHIFSSCETANLKSGTPESYFFSGILHRGEIPNIGWAMFYGGALAESVDFKRIANAGFPIEKIGEGYLVRVTEDIEDIVNDFSLFSQRRAELKALFDGGFFLIQHEPLV
ncbi:hypothetical protein [Pseudomonas caspiana]|uniref:hypothetical protein n=1 Tax=Pseudomonas caspiana TaxID=1451454 RepID=UPI0032EC9CBE